MLNELIVYPLLSCCTMNEFLIRKSRISQDSFPTYDLLSQRTRVGLKNLHSNHRLLNISSYHLNDQDKTRRYYLQRGPCQPLQREFE